LSAGIRRFTSQGPTENGGDIGKGKKKRQFEKGGGIGWVNHGKLLLRDMGKGDRGAELKKEARMNCGNGIMRKTGTGLFERHGGLKEKEERKFKFPHMEADQKGKRVLRAGNYLLRVG